MHDSARLECDDIKTQHPRRRRAAVPVFPNLGIPKIIFHILRKPLPMTVFTGKKTKGQLLTHGNYPSTANRRTKLLATFRGIFGIFRVF